MKKVIVIGGNGSGKSYFSVLLAQKLSLPLVHLDKIFHTDNWQNIPRDVFDKILLSELEKSEWIIDGNYNRTIPLRFEYCDTVFYFDFSTFDCMKGVISRTFKYYGKTRPDMADNCNEKFSPSFYFNVITFNKKHRKDYHRLLAGCNDKSVVIFKNRKQVNDYLNNIGAIDEYSEKL